VTSRWSPSLWQKAKRATLLRRGLAERVDDVRKAALVMLGKFLKGATALAPAV